MTDKQLMRMTMADLFRLGQLLGAKVVVRITTPETIEEAVSEDKVRAESICPGQEFVTHWMPLPAAPEEGKQI